MPKIKIRKYKLERRLFHIFKKKFAIVSRLFLYRIGIWHFASKIMQENSSLHKKSRETNVRNWKRFVKEKPATGFMSKSICYKKKIQIRIESPPVVLLHNFSLQSLNIRIKFQRDDSIQLKTKKQIIFIDHMSPRLCNLKLFIVNQNVCRQTDIC